MIFLVVNLASTVKTVDKGYESLQSLTYVIQDQIQLESTSDLDRERWKCLDVELSRVPPLSANGYFFISKSSLVSMLSVRKFVISTLIKSIMIVSDQIRRAMKEFGVFLK